MKYVAAVGESMLVVTDARTAVAAEFDETAAKAPPVDPGPFGAERQKRCAAFALLDTDCPAWNHHSVVGDEL